MQIKRLEARARPQSQGFHDFALPTVSGRTGIFRGFREILLIGVTSLELSYLFGWLLWEHVWARVRKTFVGIEQTTPIWAVGKWHAPDCLHACAWFGVDGRSISCQVSFRVNSICKGNSSAFGDGWENRLRSERRRRIRHEALEQIHSISCWNIEWNRKLIMLEIISSWTIPVLTKCSNWLRWSLSET